MRPTPIDRTRRRQIERAARTIRLRAQTSGQAPYEITGEILQALPEVLPLEAWRFAHGWSRQEVSARLDALYQHDGLTPPHIGSPELCKWEHGQRRPSDERIEYLCRLYRTRPDRLGFGADYSHPTVTQPPAVASPRPDGLAGGLLGVYPRRADVPPHLWWDLFQRAARRIDILVYAAAFLQEQYPDFNTLLRAKSAAGCTIRVLLGDPDCAAVRGRGLEERYGHGIETRCRVALLHYQPLIGLPGVAVHLHQTVLYNSIYRADDEMLVNAHAYGHNAFSAPVLHLRRLPRNCLFTTYADSLEAVWATSEPAAPGDREEEHAAPPVLRRP